MCIGANAVFLIMCSRTGHISGFVLYRFTKACTCSESRFWLHKFVISLYEDLESQRLEYNE